MNYKRIPTSYFWIISKNNQFSLKTIGLYLCKMFHFQCNTDYTRKQDAHWPFYTLPCGGKCYRIHLYLGVRKISYLFICPLIYVSRPVVECMPVKTLWLYTWKLNRAEYFVFQKAFPADNFGRYKIKVISNRFIAWIKNFDKYTIKFTLYISIQIRIIFTVLSLMI